MNMKALVFSALLLSSLLFAAHCAESEPLALKAQVNRHSVPDGLSS
jgi:hypothetical protein